VFRNNRNKQKINQNSSTFVKISTFLIPHTISSVCFGCFDTGPKHQNKPKQTEKKFLVSRISKPKNNQNRLSFGLFWFKLRKKINGFEDPQIFWRFFRFVSRKFYLFLLFWYRFETTKQTERNRKKMIFGFAKQMEKQSKQIEFQFVSVRTKKKIWLFRGHPSPGKRSGIAGGTFRTNCYQGTWPLYR
jgi:hypothetical protein